MSKWTRPKSAHIPTVWATFEGKKTINGEKRTYWIQDVTDEYKDRIAQYMAEEFTIDEPLCKYSKTFGLTKPNIITNMKSLWKECLDYNLGLVCLTKDENGKPTIAGMNCTTLCSKFEEHASTGEEGKVLGTLMWVKKQVDPFTVFNITEYLDAMGLYVPHRYRGEGLGFELLKAREALCRACGIKASLTLFTSQISQKLADRVGFKDLYAIDYDELERRNPKFRYPGIQEHTKAIRFMYILYE